MPFTTAASRAPSTRPAPITGEEPSPSERMAASETPAKPKECEA